MPDLHIFKVAVGMADPVALQDQIVVIHYIESIWYKRVNFLEGVPEFQCVNMGAVLANNQSVDDFQCQLFHPSGVSKAQLRNLQVPFDMAILANDPNLVSTEIGVWEDNRPAMIAVNPNVVVLPMSRVRAIGYRFHTINPVPITERERAVVAQMRAETPREKWTDGDYLVAAAKDGRIPATHIWCSGRGIGD